MANISGDEQAAFFFKREEEKSRNIPTTGARQQKWQSLQTGLQDTREKWAELHQILRKFFYCYDTPYAIVGQKIS